MEARATLRGQTWYLSVFQRPGLPHVLGRLGLWKTLGNQIYPAWVGLASIASAAAGSQLNVLQAGGCVQVSEGERGF